MATTEPREYPDLTETTKSKSKKSIAIMARVHCNECKGRFITKVEIKGFKVEKGVMSETPCKKCKEKEITSYLIFDKKY